MCACIFNHHRSFHSKFTHSGFGSREFVLKMFVCFLFHLFRFKVYQLNFLFTLEKYLLKSSGHIFAFYQKIFEVLVIRPSRYISRLYWEPRMVCDCPILNQYLLPFSRLIVRRSFPQITWLVEDVTAPVFDRLNLPKW